MALDNVGNIYVTGFSQNTNTNLGYVTIKYAPNGKQLWAARYDDTNYPTATPSGFALDNSNNVLVTGNALTIKYDTNGNQLWTAPYDGAAIAVDLGGDSIVTGYGAGFNTTKLSPNGSNLWSISYVSPQGGVVSQALVVDKSGNSYVAGEDTYVCYQDGSFQQCNAGLLTVKYDQNGNQLWINIPETGLTYQVAGIAVDSMYNFYVAYNGYNQPWYIAAYGSDGSQEWIAFLGSGPVNGLALDNRNNVISVGQDAYALNASNPYNSYVSGYTTVKINSAGSAIWSSDYSQAPVGSSAATSIAVDSANNSYVTGYCPGANGTNDVLTIKYDQNGNQIWLQRYSSPSGGNAAGNAIAVDNNGNVYVTGYDTTAAGGTEIVTIKYSPVTVQHRSDGTVILQAQGSPGESFDIEASTDLLNWLDLGSVLADTNGLMQFDDTNAPAYPSRFYYTKPQ